MSVARPARGDRIEVEEVENGLVLRHTTTRVHQLNPSASIIFELCDGTRTADGIVELMQNLGDLEEPPLEGVIECLGQLRARGLVV
ncbi:MAG: PqqD family peptide modification chaperone [Acidimicrobiia bacterium]